jgi:hypothetical protein
LLQRTTARKKLHGAIERYTQWIRAAHHAGDTTGRTRKDRDHDRCVAVKAVYLYRVRR